MAKPSGIREGRLLPTAETKANGDSWSTGNYLPVPVHMKGILSWLARWARRAGTRDFCSALAGLVQNIFFLTAHYFTSLSPHRPASWAGRRAGPPCLSESLAKTTNAF
jgi:hypothetical protein